MRRFMAHACEASEYQKKDLIAIRNVIDRTNNNENKSLKKKTEAKQTGKQRAIHSFSFLLYALLDGAAKH